MAFYRAVNSFIICALIFMAISAPFVHSFHPKAVLSQECKNVVIKNISTKVVDSSKMQQRQEKSKMMGESFGNVENSAREVPTGPDPLHHNNNPIWP